MQLPPSTSTRSVRRRVLGVLTCLAMLLAAPTASAETGAGLALLPAEPQPTEPAPPPVVDLEVVTPEAPPAIPDVAPVPVPEPSPVVPPVVPLPVTETAPTPTPAVVVVNTPTPIPSIPANVRQAKERESRQFAPATSLVPFTLPPTLAGLGPVTGGKLASQRDANGVAGSTGAPQLPPATSVSPGPAIGAAEDLGGSGSGSSSGSGAGGGSSAPVFLPLIDLASLALAFLTCMSVVRGMRSHLEQLRVICPG